MKIARFFILAHAVHPATNSWWIKTDRVTFWKSFPHTHSKRALPYRLKRQPVQIGCKSLQLNKIVQNCKTNLKLSVELYLVNLFEASSNLSPKWSVLSRQNILNRINERSNGLILYHSKEARTFSYRVNYPPSVSLKWRNCKSNVPMLPLTWHGIFYAEPV